jgi:hypothetical protein
MIQTGKDGRVLLVRLGELHVQQRDFEKAKSIDKVVESSSLYKVKVFIGFVTRILEKVKVPQNSNRA